MTIYSFCHALLLAHGPLPLDELVARAVAAGVTRARNPHATVLSALRHREVELLDGRWATGLQLLEGRVLTATSLPTQTRSYDVHQDLGLLAAEPTWSGRARRLHPEPGPGEVLCVRVTDGQVTVTVIPAPDTGTLEVAELTARLDALAPSGRSAYANEHLDALRAVAQLLVDDPTAFRTPLPPLSTWVPVFVEHARLLEEDQLHWELEQQRWRSNQVVLDDCQAIEVQLAAERAGVPVWMWLTDTIDQALAASRARRDDHTGVVVSLGVSATGTSGTGVR